jgi:signal transduction histidine kinase/ligand-binding sensor domain-containing protein
MNQPGSLSNSLRRLSDLVLRGADAFFQTWLFLTIGTLVVSPAARALNPEHKLTQYVHRVWQTQQGLPQTSIFVVTQIHSGYLWLGTESGIVRFDGVRFTPVPELVRSSLDTIRSHTIVEDSRGRVWIVSTNFGLVRIDASGIKRFQRSDGLSDGDINCAFATKRGEIWACTSSGAAQFQENGVKTYSEGLHGRPQVGCQTPDETIWLAGDGWVAHLEHSRFVQIALRSVPLDAKTRTVACRADGVWIGTTQGMIQFVNGREHRFQRKDGLPDNEVLSISSDHHGELWVGTRSGLSRFLNGAFENYGYYEGLSQQSVNSIYEDREGSLWVATKYGLNQFLDGPATRFSQKEGLPSNNIGPVLQDSSARIWAGFVDGGLLQWDGRQFAAVSGMRNRRTVALAETADRQLWVGTDQGLISVVGGKIEKVFRIQDGLPSDQIRSLFRDHSGVLWVGTSQGAAWLDKDHFVEPSALRESLHVTIAAIGEAQNKQIIFAVEGQSVYGWSAGKLTLIEDREVAEFPLRKITAMHTDKYGLVWMGTNGGGLRLLRDGKVYRFFRADGLFDGEIYGFASDAQDRLLVACSKGLYAVAKSDLLTFATGRSKRFQSFPYFSLEGFRAIGARPGVEPNVIASKDGTVWLASIDGLIAYIPNFGDQVNPQPLIPIEEATVNGKRIDLDRMPRFGPGIENLAFRYTALSFLDPQNTIFKYILEGYDRDWTDAGTRREAFYTNLPAGNFRFRVIACAPLAPCNESGSQVVFQIIPHIYQRTWFWLLALLLLTSFVWLAFRLRVRHLQSQFALVVSERTRIARELHDTLIQGFSGITMQLQAISTQVRAPDEKKWMEDIIRDAGRCLKETRESVAGLRGAETAGTDLREAIADMATRLTQEHHIELVLQLDEIRYKLPESVRHNLVCIAQEAVLNAVKHSGANLIEVSLHCTKLDVFLQITDNGRGLRENGIPGHDEHHYGITGMRERAEHLRADFNVASRPGAGTAVSVRSYRNSNRLGNAPSAKLEADH